MPPMTRRTALAAGAALTAAATLRADEPAATKGRIKQSICRWCYGKIPLDKLAAEAKKIGYQSIELLKPDEFLKIQPFGLTCAVLYGCGTLTDCLNKPGNADRCVKELREAIDFAAAHKLPNVICFSGNRNGTADDTGLKNCADALKRVAGHAEDQGVTIIMELLNSKVNHKDYMCDRTPWGVDLCKAVGSPRFKLLYDIYHMQIMEGDVIATIKANKDYIAHYHTGGVPGRNEIDETQELYYPAIVKAIIDTGYQGYLGQEFIPKRDPLASMAQAFRICDV